MEQVLVRSGGSLGSFRRSALFMPSAVCSATPAHTQRNEFSIARTDHVRQRDAGECTTHDAVDARPIGVHATTFDILTGILTSRLVLATIGKREWAFDRIDDFRQRDLRCRPT